MYIIKATVFKQIKTIHKSFNIFYKSEIVFFLYHYTNGM